MEDTYTTKAIILNKQAFREDDIKISAYSSEKGRLELVARGARKFRSKLAGHIEPISLSRLMVVRGKIFDYVGSAINENSFLNIKSDFDKISVAGRAISVFKKYVKEDEKDENTFKLLEDFLGLINTSTPFPASKDKIDNYNLILNYFVLKLLANLGYKPELKICVACSAKLLPKNNRFDLARGGVICGKCSSKEGLTISENCVKVLRIVIDSNFEKIKKLTINNNLSKEVIKIISSFYKYNF